MNVFARTASVAIVLIAALRPVEALAHGFAKRYDLPVPLEFYLAGAGATVGVSFLLLALFAKDRSVVRRAGTTEVTLTFLGPGPVRSWVAGLLRAFSAAMLVLVVAAGLIGTGNPFKNIAPTFVWVIWWVGMMVINTFVGDVWALVNPWNAWFAGAEAVIDRVWPGRRLGPGWTYPSWSGVWPTVVLFLAFAWLELIWGYGEDPYRLAQVIIVYSALTWAGMAAFGRRVWLANGEVFSVVFSAIARFAPLAFRTETGAIALRPPGVGLLVEKPISASMTALVMTMLATVTYDGAQATPAWTAFYAFIKEAPALQPLWRARWMNLDIEFWLIASPVLVGFAAAFAGVFVACCWASAALAGGVSTADVARRFALTFLPIAIAYHFAHYLTYLLDAGQYFIPAISDPFGFGWNLFGTADYRVNIAVVNARFAWIVGVSSIVSGHIVAVVLAHLTANRLFTERRPAILSQVPMILTMVAYTMLSLWIIAQPTVE